MTRLQESVDRFIDNNVNLTSEQKEEIKDFFRRHPDLNGKVNWQKEGALLKYEDFQKIMLDYANRKQVKKKDTPSGLDTLKEGVDYKIVYNGDGITGYEVLTYKASCTLASNQVEPEFWSDVDENYKKAPGFKDNVVKDFSQKIVDGETLYGGAKWCISYKSGQKHWDKYTTWGRIKFIFFIGSNVPTGKVAVNYLPKDKWGNFYAVYNHEPPILIEELGNLPAYKLYDNYFFTLPLEYILRENIRTMWNAYNTEVTGDPEYREIEEISDNLIGSTTEEDSIRYFMNVIGAEKDRNGKTWSRTQEIERDRTANFIKEHHMNRGYMVKEGKLRAKWNYWKGDFDCSGWGLETLENMPRHITGDFICKDNLEDFTEADIPEGVVIQGRKIFK